MEVIGGIGSVVGLISSVASAAKTLTNLKERYGYAPLNISLVSSSLWTVKAALEAIYDWRSSSQDTSLQSEQLDGNLSVSIESCAVLVAVIERKLGETDLLNPSVFDKLRFVRLDDVFKDFAGNMDTQVRALQLLLTIFQCRTMTEQREKLQRSQTKKLFRAVRKSTATLSYEDKDIEDAASILSEAPSVSFEMDPIVMRHPRYKASYPRLYDRMMQTFPSRQSSILTVRPLPESPRSPTSTRHKRNRSSTDDAFFDQQMGLPFLGIPFKGETALAESESETEADAAPESDDDSEPVFDDKIPLETIQEQIATIIREQSNSIQEIGKNHTGEFLPIQEDIASLSDQEPAAENAVHDTAVDPNEALDRTNSQVGRSSISQITRRSSEVLGNDIAHHENMPMQQPEAVIGTEDQEQLPSEQQSTHSWHASDHSNLYDDSADEDEVLKNEQGITSTQQFSHPIIQQEQVSSSSPNQEVRQDAALQGDASISPAWSLEQDEQTPQPSKAYIDPLQINFGPDLDLKIGPGAVRPSDIRSKAAPGDSEPFRLRLSHLHDINRVPPTSVQPTMTRLDTTYSSTNPSNDTNHADSDSKVANSTAEKATASSREALDYGLSAVQEETSHPESSSISLRDQLQRAPETPVNAVHRSSISSIIQSPQHLSIRRPSPPELDRLDSDASATPLAEPTSSIPTSPTRPPPPPPISQASPIHEGPLLPESEAILRFAERTGNKRGLARLSSKLRPRPPVPKVSFEDILEHGNFEDSPPAGPKVSESPTRRSNVEESIASSADSTTSSFQSRGQSTFLTEATSMSLTLPIERTTSLKERKRVETIDALKLQVKSEKPDKSKNRLSRFSSMIGLKGIGDRQAKLNSLALAAESGDLSQLSICLRAFDKSSDIQKEITIGNEKTPRTAFMRAAAAGSVACLEEFTKYEPDCTMTDKNGRNALHYALESGHAEAAQWLLFFHKGSHTNANDDATTGLASMAEKEGIRPIHLAAGFEEMDTFEILRDMGADYRVKDNSGRDALHYAVQKQRMHIVEHIVGRGGDVEASDSDGVTPLMLAVKVNGMNIVRYLLENGADKSKQDSNGDYAIHYAARGGFLSIIELLFLTLEDLEIKNNRGEQPLHLASAGNYSRVVRALARVPGCQINAWTAPPPAKYNTRAKASFVEVSSSLASTPLHYACVNGSYDVASVLITEGANVNANQEDGTSPLMLACESDSFGLAQLLLLQGANPNCARADDGMTALHISCKNDNLPLTKLLLDRGADFRAKLKNKYSETPSAYATRENLYSKRKAATYVMGYHRQAMAVTSSAGNSATTIPSIRPMNLNNQELNSTTGLSRGYEAQGYFTPADFKPPLPPRPPPYVESEAQMDREGL